MVHVSHDTPYMKLFQSFLAKKYRLAVDAWGVDDKAVRSIYEPIATLIKEEVLLPEDRTSGKSPLYPPTWSVDERVARLARTILVAEFLVKEWAQHFVGKDEGDLEELAKSFRFENCVTRDGLNKVLRDHAAIFSGSKA